VTILKKTLDSKEALIAIAWAITNRDLPTNFHGEITCSYGEDGNVEIFAVTKDHIESKESLN
jgi:hypothetical protein